ncbi:MAG: lamin tail domain-containing protein [Alphaproteobacteria bacterium]|nr:lamin tail domain-containing protein [Alphaproteobacteria bacterium]
MSLRSVLPFLALLSAGIVACGDKDPGDDTGPGDDTDSGATDTDSGTTAETDLDGDGWSVEAGDCDDGDRDVHPGASETCNGVDDNCNGVADEGQSDVDDDGIADCVDEETCDGLDNDGDGQVDEDFEDTDGDGQKDCLDVEECDGVDNDGDGEVDEGFDVDGDGVTICAEVPDCDDDDAGRSPDVAEVADDLIDNDCDGLVDEGDWAFGDLVITEIMNNPGAVADPQGEWIELLNTTDRTLYLNGITLESGVGEVHDIQSDTLIAVDPGEYIVIGSQTDSGLNGGVDEAYAWTGLSLSNETDGIALYAGSVELDSVDWDDGATMPDASGASMNLDELFLSARDNDIADGWCVSYERWAPGADRGTPGGENLYCPTTDHDGDGYGIDEGDCDDGDPSVGPDAVEVWYDGFDQDCNGASDYDADEDGYDSDAWGGTDCDDSRDDVNPAADEVCDDDDVDEDCNGVADDADSGVVDAETLYPDDDHDGYGADGAATVTCESPDGYGEGDGDCDDDDPTVYPGATETWYDGVDQDCDGHSDYDADFDGYDSDLYGGSDCADDDADVNPGQVEICDDLETDEDCNGLADDADPGVTDAYTLYPDVDGDGYGGDAAAFESCELRSGYGTEGGDCDDDDATVYPGADETWYDGIDGDCDRRSDYDADQDGFDAEEEGGEDCDDGDPDVYPYAWEVTTDGIDNDCDGATDDDDPETPSGLTHSDDSVVTVSLTSNTALFCGEEWDRIFVSSNGLLTFTTSTTSYSESASAFRAFTSPTIGALWDDLNPSSGGKVYKIEHADGAVGIYYQGVYEYGTSDPQTFSVIFLPDGQLLLAYDDLGLTDGLVGWTCGGTSAISLDLTNGWADYAGVLGQGDETGMFEVFGTGSSNDVEGYRFRFCGADGTDADGDGWAAECGDPDDDDAAVVP